MRHEKTQEILRSIVESTLGTRLRDDALTAIQPDSAAWSYELSRSVQKELGVLITPEEVESCTSLSRLSAMVESRLLKDSDGRSIVDTYVALEQIAREELHPDIHYHWHARWAEFSASGNWLTAPDGLDYVELVMRIEEEFGFGIPNQDAETMQTVGQTVRYLWSRSSAPSFALRRKPEDVCRSAFIFHELRRLLMVRGGVPRHAIRLDARLGELLPSWYAQFWIQVQDIFQVDLPRGCLLAFNLRIEKRITIKELVSLIISSQAMRATAPAPQRRA